MFPPSIKYEQIGIFFTHSRHAKCDALATLLAFINYKLKYLQVMEKSILINLTFDCSKISEENQSLTHWETCVDVGARG